MENKEIIIDGVDVSGCEHITCKYSLNPMCGNTGICCRGRKNCYYKQLKRKEQEVQQAMDNYVQLDLQRVKEYNELIDLYKAKEQECEELTSQRDKFEFGNNILEHERNNYKQALDGIEKQVKAMNNECFYDDICDCNNCDMKNGCSYYRKFKILDIINSVKDKNVPHKAKDSE